MNLFIELTLLIVVAAAVSGLMRLLKQPLIMGYIITGLIVGPLFLNLLPDQTTLSVFSQMGVSILLFIVGLSLSPKVARQVGKVSILAGVGQIVFTSLIGFFISIGLGFSVTESIYIAITLTLSSTIIVLKLISDKKDSEKLYGRIATGVLLVQDLVAVLALIVISALSHGDNALMFVLLTVIKGTVLTALLLIISSKLLPRFGAFFANSQEYLFLFSVAWGFGLASLFQYIGLSLEVGALIAGVSLAVSPYAPEISSRMRPLRDFFLVIFFVLLGSTLVVNDVKTLIFPAIILSLFVLIGDPFITLVIMGLLGYNKKTAFQLGMTSTQISEFSLILILLAVNNGQLQPQILSLVTLVGLITIASSSYLIMYSDKIYPYLSWLPALFESKKPIKDHELHTTYDVILFGCNRVGYDFIRIFRHLDTKFLAVDFDPEIVKALSASRINVIYGDAEDSEFLDELALDKAKMVVSTIPEYETNFYLLSKVRQKSKKCIVILLSYNIDEALKLYDLGATYVVMPHFLSGQIASELAHKADLDIDRLYDKRLEHIDYLRERKALGHLHPEHSKR
ncbi:MAG TPA: cation:proton antiporter [Candidatus Saccharimonadales bacterium]|nr:cation:proton antiporter [Candidatus Saccharimonadales bacterium]